MKRLHLIGGNLDGAGGVADYTSILAGALSSRGVTTHIWNATEPGVRQQIRAALSSEPAPVIVQYVPNAFGWRGANVAFCAWLWRLRQQGCDVRVMFHEPYFYFSAHPLRNGLAVIQRVMAAILLKAATVCYVSTESWVRYLSPYAPRDTSFVTLPIPATIGRHRDHARERQVRSKLLAGGTRRLVGHFGTFGDHVVTELAPILVELLRARPDVTVVCIGRRSELFVDSFRMKAPQMASRLVATGPLPGNEIAAVLRSCDLVVQPYPDGVTTRRTSVMAAIANEVATVTSAGFLTERIWTHAAPVAMAPAGDTRAHAREILSLLDDEPRRLALAKRGAELYDTHGSIETTVGTLLGEKLAATA